MIREKASRAIGFLLVALWLLSQVYLLNKTFVDFSKDIKDVWLRDVIEFLIFTVQLLLGGFAYDVLKVLRFSDKSWDAVIVAVSNIVVSSFVILICIMALGNPTPPSFLKWSTAFFTLAQLVYAIKKYKRFLLELNKHLKKD